MWSSATREIRGVTVTWAWGLGAASSSPLEALECRGHLEDLDTLDLDTPLEDTLARGIT